MEGIFEKEIKCVTNVTHSEIISLYTVFVTNLNESGG